MSIVHVRIDNRLLHGIVATQWAPKSGCNRVMVIDDIVASDPILKESMKLGRPAGNAVSIITIDTAIENFNAHKYDNQKVFIVVKSVKIIKKLMDAFIPITSINIGGTDKIENGIVLSKRAYADNDDVTIYKDLMKEGIELYSQYLVTDKKEELENILK